MLDHDNNNNNDDVIEVERERAHHVYLIVRATTGHSGSQESNQ